MMSELNQQRKSADDPLPGLIRALRHTSPSERLRAAKDLGRLGWLAREALSALAAVIDDETPEVREAAAHAIGQMGPDALRVLERMLNHPDKYVRRHAVWAIGKLGSLAKETLSRLCVVLRDSDPRTASGAAQALGNMGADGADAVPALVEAMRGTNIVLCRLAAKALSQIGQPALNALITHLQHSDPFVRGESALAVGWMGPTARAAVPYLATVVRGSGIGPTSSPSVASASSPAQSSRFANVTDDQSPTPPQNPNPTEPTNTPEESCRIHAAQALGRIGPSAAPALKELQEVMHTGSDTLRMTAQQAIRQIQGT